MANNDEQDPQESVPPPRRRRSSFAELFASRPNAGAGSPPRPQPSAMSAAITQQAQDQSRQRRLSITTLGLSGSPSHTQPTTPFGTLRQRGKSTSTSEGAGSAIVEDSAIEEGDSVPPMSPGRGSPSMVRRVSSGAQARSTSTEMAAQNTNAAATSGPVSGRSPASPPGIGKTGEGFSWTENFRNRAQRASLSAQGGLAGGMLGHTRTKSQATPETTPTKPMQQPAVQPPQPPKPPPPKPQTPDHMQERILKGDFYMD